MSNESWECHRCNKINAPFMSQCLCSEVKESIHLEDKYPKNIQDLQDETTRYYRYLSPRLYWGDNTVSSTPIKWSSWWRKT